MKSFLHLKTWHGEAAVMGLMLALAWAWGPAPAADTSAKLEEIRAGVEALSAERKALRQEAEEWRAMYGTLAQNMTELMMERDLLSFTMKLLRLPGEPMTWTSITISGAVPQELDARLRDVACPAHKRGRDTWMFTPESNEDRSAVRRAVAIFISAHPALCISYEGLQQ